MSVFGWCATNQHGQCVREYERFYISTGKDAGRVVWTGETRRCECTKRSCGCWKNRQAPKVQNKNIDDVDTKGKT